MEDKKATDLSGYALTRAWFDFAFENPEWISPTHTAMYCWFVELNNRMGWAEKFACPASQTMAAIGIKSYHSYKKAFDELVGFGFVNVVMESKNQYTACVIALSKNAKAPNKALAKALSTHNEKQGQSTSESSNSINKQETIKPLNSEPLNKGEATPPPPKNSEPGETLKAGKKDLEPKPTNPKPPKATQTEPAADNYQKDFLDAYIAFYESRVDIAPKITKVDAISAAELRKFLVSRCNERTEEGALNAIKYIFKKWDTLEPFLQNQVALTQINKNINNILIQVKNGFKTNKNNNSTTGPTLTEVFAMVDAGII